MGMTQSNGSGSFSWNRYHNTCSDTLPITKIQSKTAKLASRFSLYEPEFFKRQRNKLCRKFRLCQFGQNMYKDSALKPTQLDQDTSPTHTRHQDIYSNSDNSTHIVQIFDNHPESKYPSYEENERSTQQHGYNNVSTNKDLTAIDFTLQSRIFQQEHGQVNEISFEILDEDDLEHQTQAAATIMRTLSKTITQSKQVTITTTTQQTEQATIKKGVQNRQRRSSKVRDEISEVERREMFNSLLQSAATTTLSHNSFWGSQLSTASTSIESSGMSTAATSSTTGNMIPSKNIDSLESVPPASMDLIVKKNNSTVLTQYPSSSISNSSAYYEKTKLLGKAKSIDFCSLCKSEDFKLIKVIGHGSFGRVEKHAFEPIGQEVAKKTYFNKQQFEEFHQEVEFLYKHAADFIPKLIYINPKELSFYLELGFITLEDFYKKIRSEKTPISDEAATWILSNLLELNRKFYEKQIHHSDIKPANIIVSFDAETRMPCLKFIDYGAASAQAESYWDQFTPQFVQPDLLKIYDEKNGLLTRDEIFFAECFASARSVQCLLLAISPSFKRRIKLTNIQGFIDDELIIDAFPSTMKILRQILGAQEFTMDHSKFQQLTAGFNFKSINMKQLIQDFDDVSEFTLQHKE